MSTTAEMSEPASELERLIADLSGPGLQGVFDFGVDCHLAGVTTPVFRGPADRRWWHAVLGDDAASRTMDVRVDEITGVRFERRPSMFPSFPGQEGLGVHLPIPLSSGRRGSSECVPQRGNHKCGSQPEKLLELGR